MIAAIRKLSTLAVILLATASPLSHALAQTVIYDITQITTDGGTVFDAAPTMNDNGDIAWVRSNGISFYDFSADTIIPVCPGTLASPPLSMNNLGVIAFSFGGNIFTCNAYTDAVAQLTNDPTVSNAPKINDAGDVAYVNQGPGSAPGGTLTANQYEIFLYNAASATTTNVSNDSVWQRGFDLNNDGDVVFLRGAGCPGFPGGCFEDQSTEIWLFDRSANTRTRITNNSILELSPNINDAGDMAWFTYTVGIFDDIQEEINVRDAATGTITTLTDYHVRNYSLTADQSPFNDSGDMVTMASGSNGFVTDIYAIDGATSTPTQIAAYGGGQPTNAEPVINADGWVAWADGGDLYLAIPQPCVPEVCDGLDNDCNDLIDDGIPDQQSGTDVGECQVEIQSCIDGSFQVVQPGIGPTSEICDGLDNDCNGTVDNGVGDLTSGTDVGECQVEIQSCIAGSYQIVQAGIGPTSEICDGLDNDCDGTVDNGVGNLISGTDVGECQVEIQSCIGGSYQIVQAGIGPTTEICDGLDNDCNGVDDVSQGICNTPPSSGSTEFTDSSGKASIEFPDVATGGDTTVEEIACSVNVPDGYTLNTSASCYQIESTADSSTGEKIVCIRYPNSLTPAPTALLKCETAGAQNCCAVALNGTGTSCTDGTHFVSLGVAPPPPPDEYQVCISVTTLSAFGFAQLDAALDSDFDSVPDVTDNCPTVFNPLQEDADVDGLGDLCDNCAAAANGADAGTCTAGDPTLVGRACTNDAGCGTAGFCSTGQEDGDSDGVGDACDPGVVPFYATDVFETPDCYFQGGCTSADFPVDWGVLRTFSYGVPPGKPIYDVRIQGTWGNGTFGGSAPAEISLEGIPVIQCQEFEPCWDNASTTDWNGGAGILLSSLGVDFSDPAVQALFADGSADLSAVQNGEISLNVSNLKLTVYVPEPGVLAGLAAGIVALCGMHGLRERRRQRRGIDGLQARGEAPGRSA